jgi:hypothetical protein
VDVREAGYEQSHFYSRYNIVVFLSQIRKGIPIKAIRSGSIKHCTTLTTGGINSHLADISRGDSGRQYDQLTICSLFRSQPTTTSTFSRCKSSIMAFSASGTVRSSVGDRRKGERVGKAVSETRGLREAIWGSAAAVR